MEKITWSVDWLQPSLNAYYKGKRSLLSDVKKSASVETFTGKYSFPQIVFFFSWLNHSSFCSFGQTCEFRLAFGSVDLKLSVKWTKLTQILHCCEPASVWLHKAANFNISFLHYSCHACYSTMFVPYWY